MHPPQVPTAPAAPRPRRWAIATRCAALGVLAGALLPACAPPQGPARTSTPQPGVFSENGPLGPNWLTEAGSRLNRSGLDGAATSDIQPIQRPARPAGIDARP